MKLVKEIIFLLFICLITTVVGVLSTWYVWVHQPDIEKLPDLFLDILPDLSNLEIPIVNYIVLLQLIVTFLAMPHNDKFRYSAQFVFVQSIINIFRALTVSVTVLPNIHIYPYCKERPTNFIEVLSNMIKYGTCSDYMFSGHTATASLLWLLTYKHATHTWYKWVVGVLTNIAVIFLLLQRWHYTVDIIIAFVLTWLFFSLYKRYENDSYIWYFNGFIIKNDRKNREIQLGTPDKYTRVKRF